MATLRPCVAFAAVTAAASLGLSPEGFRARTPWVAIATSPDLGAQNGGLVTEISPKIMGNLGEILFHLARIIDMALSCVVFDPHVSRCFWMDNIPLVQLKDIANFLNLFRVIFYISTMGFITIKPPFSWVVQHSFSFLGKLWTMFEY